MQEDVPIGPAPAFNAPTEDAAITWFQVLDSLPLAFFLLDADHTIIRVNQQAADLWGLGPAQRADMSLQQFFAGVGNPDMYDATVALFHKKTPAKATFFARAQQKWIDVTAARTPVGWQLYFTDITALKVAQECQQALQQVIDAVPDRYLILSADLRVEMVSDAYLAATHTRRQDLIGRSAYDWLHHAADRQGASALQNTLQSFKKVLRTKRPDVMPVQHYDVPGERGQLELRFWSPVNIPVLDEQRQVRFIIHKVNDITDLVRSQQEAQDLASQNSRLQQLIEHASRMEAESRAARRRLEEAQQIGHIGSFEWTSDTDLVYWSDELYRIYGLAPQQAVMTLNQILNYTHPEDRERLEQEIFRARQQPCSVSFSHRIVRADGEVRYLIRQFESIADARGQVTMIRGTVQDITDQKRQEEAITKHLSILQQSEELARMGSWEYDVGTGAFLWSEGMYRLFGLAPGTPVQPDIYRQYVQAKDRNLAEAFIHRLRQAPQPFEETLRMKVGNRRKIFRIKAMVIADLQGRPAKVLGVDLDITEVQKLEQENLAMRLRQQKKLILAILEAQEAERKRIAEGLHNGVAQLLYAARLTLDQLPPAPHGQAYQQQTAYLLDEAIDETRRISHEIMPPILEDQGLAAAITDIGRKYSGKNLELHCQVSSLKRLLPKHLQLAIYRIAQELANNIVKHAGASRASIQIRQQDRYIALLAEDNGTGFLHSPELADGMGLKAIRDRVNLLNGTMAIDSRPNKGTLVSIYLPAPSTPRPGRRRH